MTSIQFDVPINDDDILETNETFHLSIISNSLLSKAAPNQTDITIVDNDSE